MDFSSASATFVACAALIRIRSWAKCVLRAADTPTLPAGEISPEVDLSRRSLSRSYNIPVLPTVGTPTRTAARTIRQWVRKEGQVRYEHTDLPLAGSPRSRGSAFFS